jgi:lipoate-protein ligase B
VLLLEHPPVVTLGRSTRPENLRVSPAELEARGVAVHEVARGGDVTYHGPGQLVGYPIVDLLARGECDVHRHLRRLESVLIEALAALGLAAGRVEGWTGVFVPQADPPRKLASIGVGLRGWVTYHGFALDVTMDLAGFDAIVPCGLEGVEMTSVARELGRAPDAELFDRARVAVARALDAEFA